VSVFNKKIPAGFCLTMSYGSRKRRLWPGGLTSLRLRRITSSPSQTLRRRLVRTTDDGRRGECSTLAAVRRGFVFHSSPLLRLTTL